MAEPTTSTGGAATPQSTRSSQPSHDPQQKGIVNRVKESATAQLTDQKDRSIDALGSVAQAVRSSTQRLRDERHDTIASYVDSAADQIESWSRRLKEKDIDELLGDVQRLARRQPAVFIGSAFALGLVGARFLKSSRPQNEYGYGSESRRTSYGGRPQTNTARDRARWSADEGGTMIVTEEVAIADIEPLEGTSSPQGGSASRSSRGRRSSSPTERS